MNIINELHGEENFGKWPKVSIEFIFYCNISSFLPLNGKKGPFGDILLTINLIL